MSTQAATRTQEVPLALPTPWLREREVDGGLCARALEEGYSDLQARIIAGRIRSEDLRGDSVRSLIHARIADLDRPDGLPDLETAVWRIVTALREKETIGIATDHDVDGCAAHAVIWTALVKHFHHPANKTQSWIGHRLKEGYGISSGLTTRILASPELPKVLISGDKGSSDEARIARLAAAGVDVVVTDHHECPAEPPTPSAIACVNPMRPCNTYPDRSIAGAYVAFLVMCAVRRQLIDDGLLPRDAPPLTDLLDYCAIATIADCVSMARSRNNRAVVLHGLRAMRANSRPCWAALRGEDPVSTIMASDLAFTLGPKINARGRLDDAMAGVHCLLSTHEDSAAEWAALLQQDNESRKLIEADLKAYAFQEAARQVAEGRVGLAIFLPDGHPGVHGVAASRIVEAFGRPVVCLSPKFESIDTITGSARTAHDFHVREGLATIAERHLTLLTAFGGHAGAGGVTFPRTQLDTFAKAFDQVVRERLAGVQVGPVLLHDGPLPRRPGLDLLDDVTGLDPYGRQFDEPVFVDEFDVVQAKRIGKTKAHLMLVLRHGLVIHRGVWFNADPQLAAVALNGGRVRLAVTLMRNEFRGQVSMQLKVRTLLPASTR